MIRTEHVDKKIQTWVQDNCLRLTTEQKKLLEDTLLKDEKVLRRVSSSDCTQLMQLLVRISHTKRCLEIGTLTGLNTLALALALPADGQVITTEKSDKDLGNAWEVWKNACVEHKITTRWGNTGEILDRLINEGETGKLDLILVDRDHKNVRQNLEKCLLLVKKGGIIAINGSLWHGNVANESCQDEETKALRELNQCLRDDKRVDMCMLTVGDGLTICVKRD